MNTNKRSFRTLNEVFLDNTIQVKEKSIYFADIHTISTYSYIEVLHLATELINFLHDNSVIKGDRVLIVLPTCVEFLSSFFGCLLAGAVPVAITPHEIGASDTESYIERLSHIIKQSTPKFIILDTKALEYDPLMNLLESNKKIDIINVDTFTDSDAVLKQAYIIPQKDDICFIQYTSGSTSNPKGVAITHWNLYFNLYAISERSGLSENDFGVSWLPLYHDMGLIGGLLIPIFNRFPILLFAPVMLIFKTSLWFKLITDFKASFTLGNNFALKYSIKRIRDDEVRQFDLSNLKYIFNGSEPINIEIINEFYKKFKSAGYRETAMLPCYGLAEASLAVTLTEPEANPEAIVCDRELLYNKGRVKIVSENNPNSVKIVSLGLTIQYVDLKIIDEKGQKVQSNTVGEIAICGESITTGYFKHGSISKNSDFFENWFLTGDLGFIYNENLYIIGRKKELIVIRGKNYSPIDIENVIVANNKREIAECVAFGYMHPAEKEEVLAIVYNGIRLEVQAKQKLHEEIKSLIIGKFGVRVNDIMQVRKIPKTFNGKVKRSSCYSLFILNKV